MGRDSGDEVWLIFDEDPAVNTGCCSSSKTWVKWGCCGVAEMSEDILRENHVICPPAIEMLAGSRKFRESLGSARI